MPIAFTPSTCTATSASHFDENGYRKLQSCGLSSRAYCTSRSMKQGGIRHGFSYWISMLVFSVLFTSSCSAFAVQGSGGDDGQVAYFRLPQLNFTLNFPSCEAPTTFAMSVRHAKIIEALSEAFLNGELYDLLSNSEWTGFQCLELETEKWTVWGHPAEPGRGVAKQNGGRLRKKMTVADVERENHFADENLHGRKRALSVNDKTAVTFFFDGRVRFRLFDPPPNEDVMNSIVNRATFRRIGSLIAMIRARGVDATDTNLCMPSWPPQKLDSFLGAHEGKLPLGVPGETFEPSGPRPKPPTDEPPPPQPVAIGTIDVIFIVLITAVCIALLAIAIHVYLNGTVLRMRISGGSGSNPSTSFSQAPTDVAENLGQYGDKACKRGSMSSHHSVSSSSGSTFYGQPHQKPSRSQPPRRLVPNHSSRPSTPQDEQVIQEMTLGSTVFRPRPPSRAQNNEDSQDEDSHNTQTTQGTFGTSSLATKSVATLTAIRDTLFGKRNAPTRLSRLRNTMNWFVPKRFRQSYQAVNEPFRQSQSRNPLREDDENKDNFPIMIENDGDKPGVRFTPKSELEDSSSSSSDSEHVPRDMSPSDPSREIPSITVPHPGATGLDGVKDSPSFSKKVMPPGHGPDIGLDQIDWPNQQSKANSEGRDTASLNDSDLATPENEGESVSRSPSCATPVSSIFTMDVSQVGDSEASSVTTMSLGSESYDSRLAVLPRLDGRRASSEKLARPRRRNSVPPRRRGSCPHPSDDNMSSLTSYTSSGESSSLSSSSCYSSSYATSTACPSSAYPPSVFMDKEVASTGKAGGQEQGTWNNSENHSSRPGLGSRQSSSCTETTAPDFVMMSKRREKKDDDTLSSVSMPEAIEK